MKDFYEGLFKFMTGIVVCSLTFNTWTLRARIDALERGVPAVKSMAQEVRFIPHDCPACKLRAEAELPESLEDCQ